MTISRSSCPGLSRASTPCLTVARKTWMAGHRRAKATRSFGRLCPAMTAMGGVDHSSFRGLRCDGLAPEIDHAQRGADALRGAVLETDHGVDRNVALAAIDGV